MYEFRVGDEVFHARIDDGTIEALHGPAQHPDATVAMSEEVFLGVTGQGQTLAEAIGAGSATASGDNRGPAPTEPPCPAPFSPLPYVFSMCLQRVTMLQASDLHTFTY
ncbi:hypothetical protein [Streptomyces sp. MS191]|uniref:hypothetical protein n=1 Tax=Streptomyces sp. ms191 TaxID=1827978 RepID=UPI0021CA084E|nr:hypothetical protein [Streptomyces sp. ms191]